MSAPTQQGPRFKLGELLVQAGVLSAAKLDEALQMQKSEGGKRRLGRLLVESGFVDETQLTQVLGRQLSVPWVSLYHVDFSRQLLNLVPREVAEGYGVVPVYVRHVRGQGETLYVATDDPTNEDGLRKASAYAGLPVRPMIASASDIRSAIRAYYGGGAPSASKLKVEPTVKIEHVEQKPAEPAPKPPPQKPAAPPPKLAAQAVEARKQADPPAVVVTEVESTSKLPAAPAAPAYDDTPEIEAKSLPPPSPKKKKQRAIALTFLDGTSIRLPAPRRLQSKEPEEEKTENELTARDLVAALRAVSHGAEANEILGENPRWEKMFAALLSLLLKKHLIADWEFVDEFKKL